MKKIETPALPDPFVAATRQLMGEERFARFLSAFDEEPPVSVRLNPRKVSPGQEGQDDTVPWCPLGRYLGGRPAFTFDPLLHAGCYYVQEAASMFIHHLLSEEPVAPLFARRSSLRILDLCAAPGGKSTCALGALPAGVALWSNEPVRQRASILSENIQKWGYPGCTVTCNYPRDYVRSGLLFDIILCDVPCSGEGMFRKDPQTIGEWSQQQVEKCWRLQRDIVSQAWQCLQPGGIMVYSTCTFNTKENEENVCWMLEQLDADLMAVPTEPEWGIVGSLLPGFEGPVYRFIPGITRSEGLFLAVLKKRGELKDHGEKTTSRRGGMSGRAGSGLNVIAAIADEGGAASVELNYADAVAYLRGEVLHLPADAPRGFVEVCFQGHRLGLVKNIGQRANNLYPKEWRIKSTHVPTDYQPVITTV